MMAHACNPSAWEMRSEGQNQHGLGYTRPCLETNKQMLFKKSKTILEVLDFEWFETTLKIMVWNTQNPQILILSLT